jgi:hypothetical protein
MIGRDREEVKVERRSVKRTSRFAVARRATSLGEAEGLGRDVVEY